MSKVMIVEDDDSLREIYGIRLTAEGYAVVSAHDGEDALAVAVRERPDLIISDVMMPKISGFDMLDILRSTPETQNIKVIMMTALSSEDQRQRGESLGADRYLVKSQVGIEDVVNVVHEVLGDRNPAGVINPAAGVDNPATGTVNPAVGGVNSMPQVQSSAPEVSPQAGATAVVQSEVVTPAQVGVPGVPIQPSVSESPVQSSMPGAPMQSSGVPPVQPQVNPMQTPGF